MVHLLTFSFSRSRAGLMPSSVYRHKARPMASATVTLAPSFEVRSSGISNGVSGLLLEGAYILIHSGFGDPLPERLANTSIGFRGLAFRARSAIPRRLTGSTTLIGRGRGKSWKSGIDLAFLGD